MLFSTVWIVCEVFCFRQQTGNVIYFFAADLIMDVKSLLQDYLNQDNDADYISASYQSVTIVRGWSEFLTTHYSGQVLLWTEITPSFACPH